jgi:hypothetical protein
MDNIKIDSILNLRKYEDIERPPVIPLLTIRGKTILTASNIAVISGLPKARKTSFMNLILAAILLRTEIFNIFSNFKKEDKIVLVDTEQSADDFFTQVKYLKKQLNSKKLPSQLTSYLFREDQPEHILLYIERMLLTEKPKLLIIDNITELVINANDVAESKKVILFLKRITIQYKVAIIGLMHINKGNSFTTGNLGSMLDRAAQSVLKCEIDKATDISTISPALLRSSAFFEPVSIFFNNETNKYEETKTPEAHNGTSTASKRKAFTMDKFTKEEIKGSLEITFADQKKFTYQPLVARFKQIFGMGDTIIKQTVIPYLIHKKHIKTKDGLYSIN